MNKKSQLTEAVDNILSSACAGCTVLVDQIRDLYENDMRKRQNHVQMAHEKELKGLQIKFNNFKVRRRTKHKLELQSLKATYEELIDAVRKKQSDLENELASLNNIGPKAKQNTCTDQAQKGSLSLKIEIDNTAEPDTRYCAYEFASIDQDDEDRVHDEEDEDLIGDVKNFCSTFQILPPETFECFVCKMSFSFLNEYNQHLRQFSMRSYLEIPDWLNRRTFNTCDIYFCHESGCGMSFCSLAQFRQHMQAHSEQPYSCRNCDRTFIRYDINACTHEDNCTVNGLLHCPEPGCARDFSSINRLNYHISIAHSERRYECEVSGCGKLFSRPSALAMHRKGHMKKTVKRYKCDETGCTREFVNEVTLFNHLRKVHQNYRPLKCDQPDCIEAFSTRAELRIHKITHPEKKYYCEEPGCTRKYIAIGSLRNHIKIFHLGRKPYRCEQTDCERSFANPSDLSRHMRIHSSFACKSKEFKCDVLGCTRAYAEKSSLYTHVRVAHEGFKPYKCKEPECRKSFPSPAALEKHVVCHTGERMFLCSECGRDFKHSFELTKHLRVHRGLFDFVCSLCPKSFVTPSALKCHEKIHSERKFKCGVPDCGKRFVDKNSLNVHSRIHSGEKPYACPVPGCNVSFAVSSNRNKHLRMVHKIRKRKFWYANKYLPNNNVI